MTCPCHADIEEAIEAHRPVVDRVVHRLRLRQGDSGHDDAISDGLLALWQALKDYDPRRMELDDYLNMRVRSRVIDGLRGRTGMAGLGHAKPVKQPGALPQEGDRHHPAEDGVAEQIAAALDAKATVDRLLIRAAQLDPLLPPILTLLHEGRTRSEIAELLGTSRFTISRRLRLLDDCA
jgi:RNA polymerase sigma factor (sigma-70 family)